MLLSTIICPQYLRGVGVCDCLRVCPLSLPFPSSSTVTAMRFIILHIITYSEKRDSHIATLSIRPYAKRPYSMQKALLLYYLIVILGRNTLYFNLLDALCMNPKGSQAFCFDDWRASWAYIRHILNTPYSLATANIRSNLQRIAVFRPLSMPQKSHKSFCRGFSVKNPTF